MLPKPSAPTVPTVHTVVVRLWLPDRPGALGQVASRIGAVKGDVLDIEILETGGGRVVDEVVVGLPDPALVDLMVSEVHAIDGVSVEHVRLVDGDHDDPDTLTLTLAAELAEASPDDRVGVLVESVALITGGDWALVARGATTVASHGPGPSADWLRSLLAGSSHLGDLEARASDLFWSDLPTARLWLAAGRPERPVHARERVRLDLFARIADTLIPA
jgi:hypothetical protein